MGITGCAVDGFPSVFARVSAAHDWIVETVCEHTLGEDELCATDPPTAAPTSSPPTPGPTEALVPTPPPDTLPPDTLPPTEQPTGSPGCSLVQLAMENRMDLAVEVTTDDKPLETRWELVNEGTGRIEQRSPVYAGANKFHRNEYCVPSAAYRFTIYDAGGDGLCCAHGRGSYRVTRGMKVVASGAEFGAEESTAFGGGGAPPTPSPTRGSRRSKLMKTKATKATKPSAKSASKSEKSGKSGKAESGAMCMSLSGEVRVGVDISRHRVREHVVAPEAYDVSDEGRR